MVMKKRTNKRSWSGRRKRGKSLRNTPKEGTEDLNTAVGFAFAFGELQPKPFRLLLHQLLGLPSACRVFAR